jgi:hypothetical protein
MAEPVTRVGDIVNGYCDGPGHEVHRFFTGWWTIGSGTCSVDGLSIIRVGDHGITDCGHHFHATTGSGLGSADGMAIHRVNDEVIVDEGGYGWSVTGSGTTTCL